MRTFTRNGETVVVADVAATAFLREGWTEVTEVAKEETADAPLDGTTETPKRRRRKQQ